MKKQTSLDRQPFIPHNAGRLIIAFAASLAFLVAINHTAASTTAAPVVLLVAPRANCGSGTLMFDCFDSVQAAVDAAPAGAEIRVAASTYTHTNQLGGLTQALYVSKTLTVRGGFAITNWSTPNPIANPTILDAQRNGRVIFISGDVTPTITGLHITGGDATGLAPGTLPVDPGGGVYIHTAGANLEGNWIYGNSASNGGGLYLLSSHANVNRNAVMSNTALLAGGGIYLQTSPAKINGNTIVANISQQNGGGLALHHQSDAELTNNVIAGNWAQAMGGGLYIQVSSPTMLHLSIAHNRGGDGSGIYVAAHTTGSALISSTIALTNSIISDQQVGVYVGDGNTFRLEHTLWHHNAMDWDGQGDIAHHGDLAGDPAYVNPAKRDFHIGAASASRDAGIATGLNTDIDGEARPNLGRYDIGADEFWLPSMQVVQRAIPNPVGAGEALSYTIRITNTGAVELHATVTDTLPLLALADEQLAGTVVLPGGKLVWTPVITPPNGVWVKQLAVTVPVSFESSVFTMQATATLTNSIQAVTLEGPSACVTSTTTAIFFERFFLPLVAKDYVPPQNVLPNPGFEGIGVPEYNDQPNPDNWTRDMFNGIEYGEIFSPEGWVTWWEEGDHRRPEAKVIPREIPYTFEPVRIYRGYYAAMYFSFFGTHHAGYFQRVLGLPPGVPATFYALAHGWSCHYDDPLGYSCGDPENLGFRVGIDPGGGTDPWSPNIVWSERTPSPDIYRRIGPVIATVGPGGAVTVFLRSDARLPFKHNDAYWDNAVLLVPRSGPLGSFKDTKDSPQRTDRQKKR